MSKDRRTKRLRIRLEDYRVNIWISALAFFALSFVAWQNLAKKHQINVVLETEQNGVIQLFVDSGNGYNEESSIKHEIEGEKIRQQVEFDLSGFSEIVSLRLDPNNNDGFTKFRTIDYHQPGRLLPKTLLLPEYDVSNSIRFQWNAKTGELGIYPAPGNSDPFFIVSGENLFQPIGRFKSGSKQALLYILSTVLGAALGFVFRTFVNSLIIHLWTAICIPWQVLKKLQSGYTAWVDRNSAKWRLVNPTSCVLAGALVAALVVFSNKESTWVQVSEDRLSPVLKFEIEEGDSNAVFAFITVEGKKKIFEFRSDNVEPYIEGDTVRIPLEGSLSEFNWLRIDPIEREGRITINNLRLARPFGDEVAIDLSTWRAKGHAKLLESGSNFLSIDSEGIDPMVVSGQSSFYVGKNKTLPTLFVLAIVVFFMVAVALLLYNHLQTEGMTLEQIRSLQQMD